MDFVAVKKVFYILLLLFSGLKGFSFHIVGGEMVYDDLGGGNYRMTLKVYRDCFGGGSAFDGDQNGPTAWLTVYDVNNESVGIYDIGSPVITHVPPLFYNACVQTPNSVCIEEGVYTYTLNLPPKTGGYTLVYQRCCRNSIIGNLLNPSEQGSTYFAHIPGPEDAIANNSPRFAKFPPIYICKNVPLNFDHSAMDPDGDQLVYSLCAPYAGLDGCCPSLVMSAPQTGSTCISPPVNCPQLAPPPPYNNVTFVSPYSGSYPIDANPAFSINQVTGQLVGTPTLVGQYVVGVCVQEYRNNILINTHFRDFQFTVVNCTVSVVGAIANFTQQCMGQDIQFTNQSVNNSSTPVYHWDFGVPGINTDTSNVFSPFYSYPDTGIYILTLLVNPGRACTDTLKKTIYAYPPLDIKFARPDRQCFSSNSFSFNATGTFVPQSTTFFWDFGPYASPTNSGIKTPTGIHFTQGGLFFVKLKAKQFACRDSFIDSIRVLKKPKAKINNLLNGLCDPALVGFSNGSTSDLPLSYAWQFSDGKTSNDFEPTHQFSPAGIYSAMLTVKTTSLCSDTSMTMLSNIIVHPKPIAHFTLSTKETSVFDPTVAIRSLASDDALKSTFYFGDGSSSQQISETHEYSTYGDYRITQVVINGFGCVDSVSETFRVLPEFRYWIPNCFTPDDNAKNDFFMPVTIGVSNYEFQIFDRWGENIYRSTSPEEGWNGKFRGLDSPQGIYIWKLSFKNIVTNKTEVHLGNVTLLRNP